MRSLPFGALVLGLSFLLGLGCTGEPQDSGTPTAESNTNPYEGVDNLKTFLKNIAESGTKEPYIDYLSEGIESVKANDATKGEELTQLLQKLRQTNSPEQIKATANEMLAKL